MAKEHQQKMPHPSISGPQFQNVESLYMHSQVITGKLKGKKR